MEDRMIEDIFFVNFYDHNESGNVDHEDIFVSLEAAKNRFDYLASHLNCYSWVKVFDSYIDNGRVMYADLLYECLSCNGDGDWCHEDDDDWYCED